MSHIETLQKEVAADEFIEGYVDVERFSACCAACRGYGRTWACPPYDFDPMGIWKSFSSVLLYAKKITLTEGERSAVYSKEELPPAWEALIAPVKEELLSELYRMEDEHPGSLALSAGGCDICSECTRVQGEPCRRPELMRYSVESLGGDVISCTEKLLGESILWAEDGRLPEHFIIMGALLKKAGA